MSEHVLALEDDFCDNTSENLFIPSERIKGDYLAIPLLILLSPVILAFMIASWISGNKDKEYNGYLGGYI